MTTPNVDPNSLLRRIVALEQRCADLEKGNDNLLERIESLQSNAAKRNSGSAEHENQKKAILDLFDTVPKGFKMTIPTIFENVDIPADKFSSGQVATRVESLVREGKLLRHQEGPKTPKFSKA